MYARNVKEEYETEWSGAIEWIQERQKKGPADPASIIDEYNKIRVDSFLKSPNFQDYYFGLQKMPQASNKVLVVKEGKYELSSESEFYSRVMNELVAFATANAGKFSDIVELGSGIGRNIFSLHRELAARGLTNLRYHACEYTESGRRATALLNSSRQGPEVTIHTFDYYNPDLSFLKDSTGALFFTVLSIEQIPQLPEKLFDEMIKQARNCYAIHFEPVGWQYDAEARKFRQRYDSLPGRIADALSALPWKAKRFLDRTLGTHLATGIRSIPLTDVEVGKSDKVSLNAAKWSALMQYNKNLVDMLTLKQNKGEIEIVKALKHNTSMNPFNPTTIISWKSVRSA